MKKVKKRFVNVVRYKERVIGMKASWRSRKTVEGGEITLGCQASQGDRPGVSNRWLWAKVIVAMEEDVVWVCRAIKPND